MVYKSLCYTKNKSQCWHPVISGQDQVSYSFQAGCCKYSDRRTLATKLQVKTMQALQVNDNAVRCR